MRAFKVFIFGLLYGWALKIAFDRIYRENDMEDILNENRSLKESIRSLETQLEQKSLEAESAKRASSQSVAALPQTQESEKDNLKVIKGIGPAIEKKLNNAGIYTFAALARLSVEELENILGNARRLAREGDLIAQAQELAGRK